jgi:hypothetical protein
VPAIPSGTENLLCGPIPCLPCQTVHSIGRFLLVSLTRFGFSLAILVGRGRANRRSDQFTAGNLAPPGRAVSQPKRLGINRNIHSLLYSHARIHTVVYHTAASALARFFAGYVILTRHRGDGLLISRSL